MHINTYLHLEHVRPTLNAQHEVLQHPALVQAEAAGEIRYSGVQQQSCQQISTAAGQHTLKVPASHL